MITREPESYQRIPANPQERCVLMPGRRDDRSLGLVENLIQNEMSGRCAHQRRPNTSDHSAGQQCVQRRARQRRIVADDRAPLAVCTVDNCGTPALCLISFFDSALKPPGGFRIEDVSDHYGAVRS